MDYLYLVDLNPYLTDDEIKPSSFCNCSVSSKNIAVISNDCYAYILPLEKPNELIPVNSSNSPCIQTCWSDDGKYLLCFHKSGEINLYHVKTTLLDSIEHSFSTQINSNDILVIKPFSKTPKLCFNFEKKDSPNYLEKFYYKSYSIMKNYSKICHGGFLILTKSGMLHVLMTDFNSVRNQFEKFEFDMNLSAQINGMSNDDDDRPKFELGDFSFEEDGSINVILSSQDNNIPIYLFKVDLKFSQDGLSIDGTTELLSVFNLQIEPSNYKTKLMFTSHESAKTICVAFNPDLTNQNFIQIYQPAILNQNMMGSYDGNNQFILLNTLQCPSSLVNISVSKYYTGLKDLIENRFINDVAYLIATYNNGTQGFIDMQNFNQIFSGFIPLKNNSYQNYELYSDYSLSKKIKFTQEYLVRVDQSQSGLIGIGLTNLSRLVVFRQPSSKNDHNLNQLVNNFINFYEYSILNGNDYWDLFVSTNPKIVDSLIEKLEDKFTNQLQTSLQKFYFTRHYSLMFSLYKRSHTFNHFRSQDILAKLTLNRIMSIVSFSVQFNFSIDQIKSLLNSGNNLNLSQLSSNLEIINQPNGMFNNPLLNQIQFKNNLYDYLSDLLKIQKNNNDAKQLSLNDIINSIQSRKNYTLSINQQLSHIFQWIIDVSLYLTSVVQTSKFNQSSNHFGFSLLNDIWFLNEIRKAIVYVKLIISYSTQSQGSNFLVNSVPVLPLRSSMQKDLLSELFKLYTKIIYRVVEGGSMNDESIMDACLNIQAETIIRPMDGLLFNLKYSWLGNSSTLWSNTLQFPIDHLFDTEKNKPIYPLFDIVRLIQFSRSPLTKQCIRCGNYTESSTSSSSNQTNGTKTNCIYLQDSASDKCLCGGYWVLSPLK
ncbi:unnamed protein product [Brachionus calyciflorus]|uniref:Mediator of RNA polymerase II transcription subunit 16 central helical bridge domain-containing protein n=1 Tax=Brachionus calyciflorus TaxID=104777 RepID=A0A813N893_9BILA|nr:unnamed protein product [Brachionus calyciflorus]